MSAYESAFPYDRIQTESGVKPGQKGLSKREYFAGVALQGLLASQSVEQRNTDQEAAQMYAKASIIIADELLKQLDK